MREGVVLRSISDAIGAFANLGLSAGHAKLIIGSITVMAERSGEEVETATVGVTNHVAWARAECKSGRLLMYEMTTP